MPLGHLPGVERVGSLLRPVVVPPPAPPRPGRRESWQDTYRRLLGKDPRLCPACRVGRLVVAALSPACRCRREQRLPSGRRDPPPVARLSSRGHVSATLRPSCASADRQPRRPSSPRLSISPSCVIRPCRPGIDLLPTRRNPRLHRDRLAYNPHSRGPRGLVQRGCSRSRATNAGRSQLAFVGDNVNDPVRSTNLRTRT